MAEEQGAFLVPAGTGRPTRVPTPNSWFKAVGGDTGGAFTVLEYVVAFDVPWHTHVREHESLYVLEGDVQVRVGEEQFAATVGDFAFLPQGLPHALSVAGGATARILAVSTPGGFEHFMEDMMEALAAGHDRASAEVAVIREKHGWIPAG